MALRSASKLTICGIEELDTKHGEAVTHVLSLLDPERADPEAFKAFGTHDRTILHFHDTIAEAEGRVMPEAAHVEQILAFGQQVSETLTDPDDAHLLVHCHMGISRSTAAMLILMAQASPDEPEDSLFERLRTIRPRAWPNSVMIAMADDMLGREGRLSLALRRHYGFQNRERPEVGRWMIDLGREAEVASAL